MSTLNSTVSLAANAVTSTTNFNGFASKEEFMALLTKAKAGDTNAANAILLKNMGMLYTIANSIGLQHVSKKELVQSGVIAFLERLSKYNPELGTLSTFMWQNIKHAMYMGNINGMSNDDFNFVTKITKTKEEFLKNLDREPTEEELAQATGYKTKTYRRKVNEVTLYSPASLDLPVGNSDDGERCTLLDFDLFSSLESVKNQPDYELLRQDTINGFNAAWNKLSDRERMLLSCRYDAEKKVSLRKMEEAIGGCRETIRAVELPEAKKHFKELLEDYGIVA